MVDLQLLTLDPHGNTWQINNPDAKGILFPINSDNQFDIIEIPPKSFKAFHATAIDIPNKFLFWWTRDILTKIAPGTLVGQVALG
ncbi:hypothetical protein [uncultured Chitinophaga sp.]|uniref:hypothetical protein n=1 Tax=uncultured Chitinophaga sp. TaxID=339340 RepID=UPI0025E48A47|nr:hypothetical protein [uncultured Chitinophaga sp.]